MRSLTALLPLLHGVQVPAEAQGRNLEERLAEFKRAEFVGAIVVGEQVPETVGLVYAGVPMGWFDAQGTEHDAGGRPPATRSLTVRAYALEHADTFAAINLALDKQIVARKIREVLRRDLAELAATRRPQRARRLARGANARRRRRRSEFRVRPAALQISYRDAAQAPDSLRRVTEAQRP